MFLHACDFICRNGQPQVYLPANNLDDQNVIQGMKEIHTLHLLIYW